jgi:hypothetical protein
MMENAIPPIQVEAAENDRASSALRAAIAQDEALRAKRTLAATSSTVASASITATGCHNSANPGSQHFARCRSTDAFPQRRKRLNDRVGSDAGRFGLDRRPRNQL